MAAVNPTQDVNGHHEFSEEKHTFWMKAFDSSLRSAQLAEDSQAWGAVAGTLITIVAGGLVLAVVSVAICLWLDL